MNSRLRDKAKDALWYYFARVADKAGMNMDSDNRQEITEIVDLICDAVKEEVKYELINEHHRV